MHERGRRRGAGKVKGEQAVFSRIFQKVGTGDNISGIKNSINSLGLVFNLGLGPCLINKIKLQNYPHFLADFERAPFIRVFTFEFQKTLKWRWRALTLGNLLGFFACSVYGLLQFSYSLMNAPYVCLLLLSP